MDSIDAAHIVRVGEGLFSRKKTWDQLCQDIAENFYPLRSNFTRTFTLGDAFSTGLMESYPVQARETLANMPNSVLRQGDWFAVKTGFEEQDEDPEIARWLEAATKRFRRLIYDRRANFVRATGEADHDWVTFGNAVISVEESPDREHFLFKDWHPRDCAWLENSINRVDCMHRNFEQTARNVVRRWGDKVHTRIKDIAKDSPSDMVKLRHVVLPADEVYGSERKMRKQIAKTPFVSVYIDVEHNTVLQEGWLPVFNYVPARWKVLDGFPHGFSPATINALPDGRMIQALGRILLEQGEKAVDPPIVAKGEIFRDAINLYAGGMTYVDLEADERLQDVFQPVSTSQAMALGLDMKQDVRNLIAESFLLNKLMLPSAREMTAFETNARLEEFRRAALPFFGPIESEYHLPLLDTAFQMAVRNGAFDFREMPEALQDADVTFTFESPLNSAEGRKNVVAFQESIQILSASAQMDQGIPATMDFKQMTKDAVKGTGAPADWFNDEQVEQTEEAAARNVQGLAAMAGALREGAGVATDVANATVAMRQAGLA